MADGRYAGIVGADHCVCRLGQVDAALLADDLAADVIAVAAIYEGFYINAHAGFGGQIHDLRVAQLAFRVAGGLGEYDLGSLVVFTEQPAQNVDFVDHGVLNRHRSGKTRCVIVAVYAVQHERQAVLAGIDSFLELIVARVIAAHEADLNQLLAGGHLSLYDALAGIRLGCQRLFAEYILAGLDCRHDVLLVKRIERGNNNGVDFVRSDHLLAALPSLDGVLLGNRLAEINICVRAADYLCTLQGVVDTLNVRAADCARAYQTDFQFFHDISSSSMSFLLIYAIFSLRGRTRNSL